MASNNLLPVPQPLKIHDVQEVEKGPGREKCSPRSHGTQLEMRKK